MERKLLTILVGMLLVFMPACSDKDVAEQEPNTPPAVEEKVDDEETDDEEQEAEEEEEEEEQDDEELIIPEAPTSRSLSAADLQQMKQMEGFYYDFFKAAVKSFESKNENLIVSPMSAQILLSMLANACGEEGAQEIAYAMRCGSVENLNSLAYKCRFYERPDYDGDSYKFALANSVWYSSKYNLRKNFNAVMDVFYDGAANQRDFTDASAIVDEVNRWCADNTNNLITRILESIDPSSTAILANALYYSSLWNDKFLKERNTTATFHGVNSNSQVEMMHSTYKDGYISHKLYDGVRKPLIGPFDVWFVLPKEGVDIDKAAEAFDYSAFDDEAYTKIILSLPKFSCKPERIDISSTLEFLGIKSLFNPAELKMFTTKLKGAFNIYQKSTFSVDEDGVVASAVTVADSATAAGGTRKEIIITLDRPFLFFLQDWQTGACIMAGKVVQI